MDMQDIQQLLYEKLDKKRYEHTLGVMYTTAALCMQHEVDVNQGMLAGLLHDCAKEYKNSTQYDLCKSYKIPLNQSEKVNHALVHAKLGAYMAKKEYGIKDEAVLSAILCHTTGKPKMNTLEKILYISDYIEPHRKLPRVEEMRILAFKDLDRTIYCLLSMSLEHLRKEEKVIDNRTIETYNYYKNKVTKNIND